MFFSSIILLWGYFTIILSGCCVIRQEWKSYNCSTGSMLEEMKKRGTGRVSSFCVLRYGVEGAACRTEGVESGLDVFN